MRYASLLLVLMITACVNSPKVSKTQAELSGLPGTSLQTGVVLECVSSGFDGVMKEGEWIRKNYPGYAKLGQAIVSDSGRVYDRITIRKGNDERSVYFEITDWFGVYEAIELPPECN